MDRLQLVIGITIGVLLGSTRAEAAYTVPAVNLPAQTPDIVRDRVARSLASTRDTVGRVLHPFHGEFHGFGTLPLGQSNVTDLSGDGRVVVGSDSTLNRASRSFVWSPATGKAQYNMHPSGTSNSATPTVISADGVYIGGIARFQSDVSSYSYSSATLWSLAGGQRIPTPEGRNSEVSALSGDGKVAVGVHLQPHFFGVKRTAYRYTRGGILQNLESPFNGVNHYLDAAAMDVTSDGNKVLVNGFTNTADGGSEPFLWSADGAVMPLGRFNLPPGDASYLDLHSTTATAISADGSTVIGGAQRYSYSYGNLYTPVLWRDGSGWSDLGAIKSRSDEMSVGGLATHLSGDGDVVIGWANVSSPLIIPGSPTRFSTRVAFIWDEDRGMRKLSDVLQLDYGLDLSGWRLNEAAGISDDGTTIIGNGLNPSGQNEAWRAVLARTTPLGDIDFDGDIDPQDYAQLTSNLGAASDTRAVFYADGDLNADGRVDQSDAATLLGLYQGRKQGDFNADGVVNMADYTVWRDNLGRFTGGLADTNGDGWVNQTDLAVWRKHFGSAISAFLPLSVPEPTAVTLLAMAALAAVSRRR